ncbi:hypothetical protein ACFL59_15885, partial [Planctomycetota bacterium]
MKVEEAGAERSEVAKGTEESRCYWSLLYDVPEIIGSHAFRFQRTADHVLGTAVQVSGAERGLLFFFDRNRDLAVRAALGFPADLDPASSSGAAIAKAIDRALRSDRPIAWSPQDADEGDAACYLAVPLHGQIREPDHGLREGERRRFPGRLLAKQLGAIYVD